MSASYGGYLALAAQAFHPGAFEAAIDIFGVTNWTRTLEEAAPSSPARVAIAELAARLVGIPTPTRRRGRRGTMDS